MILLYRGLCKLKTFMERKMLLKNYRKARIQALKRIAGLEERSKSIRERNTPLVFKKLDIDRELDYIDDLIRINKSVIKSLENFLDGKND